MSPIDDFLQAVARKLHGPAQRRPEVIEELRGHLADRIEVLVGQEYEPEQAETQAIEEMGPAWLLALRLSLANGWYLLPEILREMGALGFGIVMIGSAACNLDWLQRMFFTPGSPSGQALNLHQSAGAWLMTAFVTGHLILLLGLTLFAVYLTRLRQSMIWALFPTYFLIILIPSGRNNYSFYYLIGALFIGAVVWGVKKPSPRLVWPLWAAAGLVFLTGLGADLANNVIAYHLPISLKMVANYFYWSPFYNSQFWLFVGATGFPWLAAWMLERAHTPSIIEASE